MGALDTWAGVVRGVGRGRLMAAIVGAALLLTLVMAVLLGRDSPSAVFLFDYSSDSAFPYPFTIQNVMHGLFAVGLAELLWRWAATRHERGLLAERLLPEDDHAVLRPSDLGPIRVRVAGRFDDQRGFLPYLLDLCILQFQASRSVDQTVSVLNSSLELMAHRLDLRYTTLRYLVWVIPTMGFIGTVVGIAGALSHIDPQAMDLKRIAANLGVAFYTTIVALVQSAVLVLLHVTVQKGEESALNDAGTRALRGLVNRLYVPAEEPVGSKGPQPAAQPLPAMGATP